jgi:hypothetical protein
MANPKKILAALEKDLGRLLPERYRRFVESGQIKDYRGLWCGGLPGYDPAAAFKVAFPEPGFSLFEEHEIDRAQHPDRLPLCSLGKEPQFLSVALQGECPVEMWDHETGQFRPFAASIDEFLKKNLSFTAPAPAGSPPPAAPAAPPKPAAAGNPLFDAVRRGDLEGIRAAVAAGCDIHQKEPGGSTALHKALMNHEVSDQTQLSMGLLLIELGADLRAEDADRSSPLEYTSSAMAKKLEAAFQARGSATASLPEFVEWKAVRVAGSLSLGYPQGIPSKELSEGKPWGNRLPKDVHVPARTDYEDWKQETKLVDCFAAGTIPVVSARMKTFLASKKLGEVEYLPVVIHDHGKKPVPSDYFVVNPPAFDCIDLATSGAELNPIDKRSVLSMKRLMLMADRIPASAHLFRVQRDSNLILLRRAAAQEIAAENFVGFGVREMLR